MPSFSHLDPLGLFQLLVGLFFGGSNVGRTRGAGSARISVKTDWLKGVRKRRDRTGERGGGGGEGSARSKDFASHIHSTIERKTTVRIPM